jgi:hypothetical protein
MRWGPQAVLCLALTGTGMGFLLPDAARGGSPLIPLIYVRRAKARSFSGCESHPANCRSSR